MSQQGKDAGEAFLGCLVVIKLLVVLYGLWVVIRWIARQP